jgi:hypothetical protein
MTPEKRRGLEQAIQHLRQRPPEGRRHAIFVEDDGEVAVDYDEMPFYEGAEKIPYPNTLHERMSVIAGISARLRGESS